MQSLKFLNAYTVVKLKSMEPEKGEKTDTPQVGLEIILGKDLQTMFCRNFDPNSIDPLGYDVRLGEVVKLITSGEEKILEKDEGFMVLPGETLLARTEEILQLPDYAFALGSPKMSLLASGLWSHGGKTDPGFNHSLTLGFMNVGNTPVPLKRGQKIFHLTFYKINGVTPETAKTYAGTGINLPSLKNSPLQECRELNSKKIEEIKQTDGIKSYRLCNYLLNAQNANIKNFRIMLSSLLIGNVITVAVAIFWVTGKLDAVTGFTGVLVAQVITDSALAFLSRVPDLFKKKE